MERLKAALVAVRHVCDCEACHNLLLDAWLLAVERGEEEGLAHAAMLRRCVAEYVRLRGAPTCQGESG